MQNVAITMIPMHHYQQYDDNPNDPQEAPFRPLKSSSQKQLDLRPMPTIMLVTSTIIRWRWPPSNLDLLYNRRLFANILCDHSLNAERYLQNVCNINGTHTPLGSNTNDMMTPGGSATSTSVFQAEILVLLATQDIITHRIMTAQHPDAQNHDGQWYHHQGLTDPVAGGPVEAVAAAQQQNFSPRPAPGNCSQTKTTSNGYEKSAHISKNDYVELFCVLCG